MSSLARAATPAPSPASTSIRLGRLHLSTDSAVALCLALGLVVVTFVASGGVDLGPNTWIEIALALVGAAAAVAVLLIGAPGRRWGAMTLVLFLALVALTAVSVSWSVEPDNSWTEAGRTLSYMAVFGGAIALARLFPARWPAVLGALALTTTLVCGYALLAKAFPAALDPGETFGRLRVPFDYWNATGLLAALGLPPCLWAGARRERARALRALAVPAVAILISVAVLSYSRGTVLVAVAGLAVWFALVPLRLRGALVLALGSAGGAVISIYAIDTRALTGNLIALSSRATAGHAFGVLLVLVLGALTVAGFAAAFAMDRVTLRQDARRRVGTALLIAVALVPVAGVAGLAVSSRGLTGEVSHVWSTLTSTSGGVSTGPTRLVQLGNSRGRYWREGFKVGEHALLKGVGALGYGTAVTRYTSDHRTVGHAHSYVVETFADFGLIGVALMVAMLASWALAARRTLGPDGVVPHTAERTGLMTMLAVVVIFGLHSTIDWTWFIPGTAIPALLCAGWLAGRGPIGEPVGTRPRTRITASPGTAGAVLGIATVTLLCCWAVWQPLRASDADAAALNAIAAGHTSAAIGDAKRAADYDPVAVDPLFELAAFYTAAGDPKAAHDQLVQAVQAPAGKSTDLARARRVQPEYAPAAACARPAPEGGAARPQLGSRPSGPGPRPATGLGHGRMRRRLAQLLAIAAAAIVFPAAAAADHTQESIFQDDQYLLYSSTATVNATLATLRSLGVDRVRITVKWSAIAPAALSSTVPARFDATNPADYPAAGWAPYDRVINLAAADGIGVEFNLTAPGPLWAMRSRGSAQTSDHTAPGTTAFKQFVQAVGTRYGGTYDGLPRVNVWSIWNEPNQPGWLAPQALSNGRREVPISPWLYRVLVQAGFAGLRASGHTPAHDTILVGELAPEGYEQLGTLTAMTPMVFLRALYCVDDRFHRLRGAAATAIGCPARGSAHSFVTADAGLFHATGFAHHPYYFFWPPHHGASDPNFVPLANLGRLEHGLDRVFAVYGVHRHIPIYLTEYGYQTNPPDPYEIVTPAEQASYLNQSDYLAWRNPRVRSVAQFLLRDSPPNSAFPRSDPQHWDTFQTGLEYVSGRHKPAYAAYRMPIWIPTTTVRRGARLFVWGQLRPARRTATASIQWAPRHGGRYRTIARVRTRNRRHFVTARVRLGASGFVRIRWGRLVSRAMSVSVA